MQLLLLLVLLSSGPATSPAVVFHRISASTYALARRAARPVTVPATFPLRARNGQFTIPTSDGPQTYRNVVIDEKAIAKGHSEAEAITYNYHGFLQGFRRHVVEVEFYETGEWWLISPEGGRLTLYGAPLYAPDQQSVAAICPGLEYEAGQPNAVQLLRLQKGVLRLFWEVRPANWEPEELFWVNATTLYLKRMEYSGGHEGSISYWKLTLSSATNK